MKNKCKTLRQWKGVEIKKRENHKKTRKEIKTRQEENKCYGLQIDEDVKKKNTRKSPHQETITSTGHNETSLSTSTRRNPVIANSFQECRCRTHANYSCSRRIRLISPSCRRHFDLSFCASRNENETARGFHNRGKSKDKHNGRSMRLHAPNSLLRLITSPKINDHTKTDKPEGFRTTRGRRNPKHERNFVVMRSFNNSNINDAHNYETNDNKSNSRHRRKGRSKSKRHKSRKSRGSRSRSKSRKYKNKKHKGSKSRSKSRKSRGGRTRSKSRKHKSRKGRSNRSRSKSKRHRSRRKKGSRSRSKSKKRKNRRRKGRRSGSKHRRKSGRRKSKARTEEQRLSDNALDIFKTMVEKMPKSQKKLFAHYFHARRPDAWNDLLKVVTGLIADKHMQKLESRADYMKSFTATRPEYFRRLNNLEEAADGLSKLVALTWSELEKEVDFCVNLETCHDDASMLKSARQTLGSDWLLSQEVMNNLSQYFTSEMPFEWNEDEFNKTVHDKMLSSIVSEAL